ncbi:Rieske 2Fe-2S domain-containing protein [Streptomyces sp. NPDC001549]|uniref:Rieske 2Fe-2S domain-containing protein n=1 Tax=Streptomyces sp. NPDC001549 TaxID=3364586 RepID=UPI0036B47F81
MSGWRHHIVRRESPKLPYASGEAPLPGPEGWVMLAPSTELRPGDVVTRRLMGEDVVIYRTRAGRVRVVRPYCPHLGAHLGCGGKVEGENIVCPFHHFAFGPDGDIARLGPGYTGKLPRDGLTVLPSEEVNDGIFAWIGTPRAKVPWRIPSLLDARGSRPRFTVLDLHTHPQEVFENIVDVGHVRALHGYTDAEHARPPVSEGHTYSVPLRFVRPFPPFGNLRGETEVTMYGLGFIHARSCVPEIGLEITVMLAPRLIEAWRIHLSVGVSVLLAPQTRPFNRLPQSFLRAIATAATPLNLRAVAADLYGDVPVWNTKVYASPPRLAAGDGPIGAYRHWARQFYPADRSGPDS